MKRVIFKIIALILVLIPCCLLAQPKVVFDTDIDSDVDDVGALAMLLNMHNNNEITLAAIIVTSDDPYAPLCVSAMCDFYTQDNIPIGFLKGQKHLKNHSRYTRQISEQFSMSLKHHAQAEDGVELYRRILAESKNNDVTIITVGHLSSLILKCY
jgi:inosine-uridine nucleoside N-ribohydrolase